MSAILLLASTAVVVWVLGAFVFVYFWPRITVGGFKRIFVRRGLGGPIPVNTLFVVPESPSRCGPISLRNGTPPVAYFALIPTCR